MRRYKLILLVVTCFILQNGHAQFGCLTLGQNPGTAFPVCGTDTFKQSSVNPCGGRAIPGPCSRDQVTDVNPYWYKFTCFATGTLGFLIRPNGIDEDYDWQLFDVTNAQPDDVYTNAALFVACNWSGETGNTGASSAGTSLVNCGGVPVPLFSKMPTLVEGHQYLLLISHFTVSQSGYALTFGGGTASITDPVVPHLAAATANCNGSIIAVKLNKAMKCTSIDADGSDFIIVPGNIPITGATGIGCDGHFDVDSVALALASPLPPGNYQITVRANNNLLDNCDNFIPSGDTLSVTVSAIAETPMDSLLTPACAPNTLQLVFKDAIRCNSIAADGSDFIITGGNGVTVTGAAGVCDAAGSTTNIQVTLSSPIKVAGNFSIQLARGTDGNTIINACGKETAAGETIAFTTKDTVSAAFTSNIHYGCISDTILYAHDGRNGVNSWNWNFGNNITSTSRDTTIIYPVTATIQVFLSVSNGVCADTATTVISFANYIKAAFEGTALVCPGDPASFINQSVATTGSAFAWNFGNGSTSTLQQPANQYYPSSNTIKDIPVQLIVTNNIGCSDTATNTIRVVGNCYIAVPKAFSPNGDGLNDYLYPTNAYKATDLLFMVFNRAGQKVFETRDWTQKWDGTFKGSAQDSGTYVWVLSYIDTSIDNGKKVQLKGSTILLR